MSVFRRPPTLVMETDVAPVPAGGLRPGWVTGTPANAPDGTQINALFDLGPDWDQYTRVAIGVRSTVATSLSNIAASFRNDGVATMNNDRTCRDCVNGVAGSIASLTVSSIGQFHVNVSGRYLVVKADNTAAGGAQGPNSKFVVTALTAP